MISCSTIDSSQDIGAGHLQVEAEKLPEVFRAEGFVFFFFSNEGHEPVHVHVRKAGGYAKYWIDPVGLEFARAMKVKDLSRAEELIIENVDKIRERWNEVFNL